MGGMTTAVHRGATGRDPTGGGGFGAKRGGGRGARAGALGRPGKKGRGGGRGGGGGGGRPTTLNIAPKMTGIKTSATAPKEMTEHAKAFTGHLGKLGERTSEIREKGGAFLEESGRQGRESVNARIEEARQRAAEQGVPFDEQAAMREALKGETGARSEGLQSAEDRLDRSLGAETGAYISGTGTVAAPHQMALQQKSQSLAEQNALMNYWLGQENAETARFAATQQAQTAWMSMLGGMLNTGFA